jgi:hypothetical protein
VDIIEYVTATFSWIKLIALSLVILYVDIQIGANNTQGLAQNGKSLCSVLICFVLVGDLSQKT